MASLISPGVSVSIVDESFYGSADQGTIPLIVIATSANKTAAAGSSIAPGTTAAQTGKLYLATSQRDLLANYGLPFFSIVQGTPVHGDELNEYGLHAAYSFLGIANRAFILRADLDTAQLAPSSTAPRGLPLPGTYWFDLNSTSFGLFRSNGSAFAGSAWVSQKVTIPYPNQVDQVTYVPLASFGANGDFAVVPWVANNLMYEKIGGTWFQIGTTAWASQRPTTITGTTNPAPINSGDSITINGVAVTFAAPGDLATAVQNITQAMTAAANTTITAAVIGNTLVITNIAGGDLTLVSTSGTALTVLGLATSASGVTVVRNADASWPSGTPAGSLWVKGNPANLGAKWVMKYYDATSGFVVIPMPFVQFDSTKNDGDLSKDALASAQFGTPSSGTLYVGFDPVTGVQQIRRFDASGTFLQLQEQVLGAPWQPLEYEADFVAPSTAPAEGTLWYDPTPFTDLMVGNGEQWVGYRRMYPQTDSTGVILSGSAPVQQVGGHTILNGQGQATTSYDLVDNDLWIDTSDLENYPTIYRWSTTTYRWGLIDKTDHSTPSGIVFSDARQDSGVAFTGMANPNAYAYNSTAIGDLLISDYVDPDLVTVAPANAHASGTLLFNTRLSTGNVKVWRASYFNPGAQGTHADINTDYTVTGYGNGNPQMGFPPVASAGRWVDASGADTTTLVPYMLRRAQRAMVVKAMAAQIASNQDIRSELVHYNLIAAPGYIELLAEMQGLNIDQKEVSFIVGDTPIRLAPDGASLNNYATNAADASGDGDDALITRYDFAGVYYPWGLGEDLAGNSVMIPPSTIALRTMAYNDQVAFPWFAPAGFQRGLVSNASSVGYLNSQGAYNPVILNQGQRDTLYSNSINPIAYIVGRGLVVYGQKTLAPVSSALDRINVARLVNYIKYNLDIIVKPYLFEQNDASTQKAAKNTVERFFNSLVGSRALYDYAVLCDSSNNTPDRVDRNELWIDCAIQPIKAVEFIYVPVRIQNTSTASVTL